MHANVTDNEAWEGGCLCGAIRYRLSRPPRRVTHCHCLHCRQSGGAAFQTWVELDAGGFSFLSGTPARYECRPGVTRQFCGRCGTPLTYQRADDPGTMDVTACSMDDPSAVAPDDHVWCDRMIPWLEISDGLPRYRRGRSDG